MSDTRYQILLDGKPLPDTMESYSNYAEARKAMITYWWEKYALTRLSVAERGPITLAGPSDGSLVEKVEP